MGRIAEKDLVDKSASPYIMFGGSRLEDPNIESSVYVDRISQSGVSIYHAIEVGSPLWIPTSKLERLLDEGLKGMNVGGLPNRTRSKVVKQKVCEILGYPTPLSFARTKPRFLGQQFDTYIQKSNNLQIWNEELSPIRRYVIIKVTDDFLISKVKVVTGTDLAKLDTTGTLTQKYQARLSLGTQEAELFTSVDTDNLLVGPGIKERSLTTWDSPTDIPIPETLLRIGVIFESLSGLLGMRMLNLGPDQERNQGAELHRLVCKQLGYSTYKDDGQFPDVPNQILEVKFQSSTTIDLGLVLPNSQTPLDLPLFKGRQIRHCDVRYAIFFARKEEFEITLTHVILTTGEMFFKRFKQFEGRVLNTKLQIPLPSSFFQR